MAIIGCLRCGCRGSEYNARFMQIPGGFLCVSAQMCDRRRRRREREEEQR